MNNTDINEIINQLKVGNFNNLYWSQKGVYFDILTNYGFLDNNFYGNAKSLIFNEVDFEDVIFECDITNLFPSITFCNCTFKHLTFKNFTIIFPFSFQIPKMPIAQTILGDINFKNCSFNGFFDITYNPLKNRNGKNEIRNIHIGKCKADKININNLITECIFIKESEIDSITLYDKVIINNFLALHMNTINWMGIKNIDMIDRITGSQIAYSYGFYKSLNMRNNSIKTLRLNNNFFEKIQIIKSTIEEEFHIENSFVGLIEFSKSTIKNTYSSKNKLKKIEFKGKNIIEYYSNEDNIEELNFSSFINKDFLSSFNNSNINSIGFNSCINEGKIYFNNLSYKSEEKYEFNEPRIVFNQIGDFLKTYSVDGKAISFINSDIGNVSFVNINWSDYTIKFINSNIIKAFFSNEINCDFHTSITNIDRKLFYMQLKKAYENQGDNIYSMHLKCKILEIERQETDLFNKIILFLSWHSNRHNTNYLHSLIWVFIYPIIFYLLYLYSIDRLLKDTCFDLNLVGYYFEFINPTHKIGFIESKLNGLSIFYDFLGRIFVGFSIYQFIRAFRKYGGA